MEEMQFAKIRDRKTLEGILGMLICDVTNVSYRFMLEQKKYEMNYDKKQKAYVIKEIKEKYIIKNVKYKLLAVKK